MASALGERSLATPRLACEALARAINGADLEAALACFTPGAVLVDAGGDVCQGETAIRARLAELIARGTQVEIELRGVIVAEQIALGYERWEVSHDGAPDSHAADGSAPTLVLRLIEEEWRLAIAAPWGAPMSPPLRMVWP